MASAAEYVSISRNNDWKVSTGPDLYRRGMYIVFRRATPYPMLLTFDAPPTRRVACTAPRTFELTAPGLDVAQRSRVLRMCGSP